MKHKSFITTIIVSLVMLTGFSYAQESVVLKYQFPNGKSFVQKTQVNSDIVQTMMGQEMKMKSEVSTTSDLAIESVSDEGNATMLISMLDANVHSVAMGRDTAIQMNDLKDVKRVVISSLGKLLSEVNVDTSKVLQVMGSMSEYSKLPMLPGKSVVVGEKWIDKVKDSTETTPKNPFAMSINNDMEYTFSGKELKDGVEFLKITYTGSMMIAGKGIQMGMEMFIEGTGKTEGYYLLNKESNLVFFSEGKTEMDMSIAVSGQQNMTIPMTQSMVTTMTLEEKK